MNTTRQEISDASMVSLDKVNKDIQRGRLDGQSLVSIACYVVMGRMGAGGLRAVTGCSSEPVLHEVDKCPVDSEVVDSSFAIHTQMTSEDLLRAYHKLMEDPEIHQERLSEIVKVLGYVPGD